MARLENKCEEITNLRDDQSVKHIRNCETCTDFYNESTAHYSKIHSVYLSRSEWLEVSNALHTQLFNYFDAKQMGNYRSLDEVINKIKNQVG